jgi:hypothetical protein
MKSVLTPLMLEFESRSERGVQHYLIKFVSVGWWFSLGPPVSSTNKTVCQNIAEILLKVVLNTIKPNQTNLSHLQSVPKTF